MRPQTLDRSENVNKYLAEINGWNYNRSLYLAGSLKGIARALLSELNREQQRDYNALVRALTSRYGSDIAEMFRAQLQTRVRGKDESLPELAQSDINEAETLSVRLEPSRLAGSQRSSKQCVQLVHFPIIIIQMMKINCVMMRRITKVMM
jgi:hypothetical protein